MATYIAAGDVIAVSCQSRGVVRSHNLYGHNQSTNFLLTEMNDVIVIIFIRFTLVMLLNA